MRTIGLAYSTADGETPLEAALRMAKPWGLEAEVTAAYQEAKSLGRPDQEAAMDALFEWDLCDVVDVEEVKP